MLFLKKGVIWKKYKEESVLCNMENEDRLILNRTSNKILDGLLIYRSDKRKIASTLMMDNNNYNYEEIFNDVEECYNNFLKTDFFTNNVEDATLLSLIGVNSSLETATIEITDDCNLDCTHCYRSENRVSGKKIDIAQMEIIADKLSELGVHSVVLTGGEPFLNENLSDFIRILNDCNIRVVVFTNGQIYDEVLIKKLSDMKGMIRISLEGHTAELNDVIRGENTFFNAEKFARLCTKNNIKIGYSFTCNSKNERYFLEMIEYAERMGAYEIEISEVIDTYEKSHVKELLLSKNQLEQLRRNTLKGFAVSKAFRRGMGLYRYKNKEIHICSAGFSNIFIDVKGKIYPCNLFVGIDDYCVGNIFIDDLLEIWRKNQKLIELRNLSKEDIESCRCCSAKNNCAGGCRARAVLANGNIKAKMDGYFCDVTRDLALQVNV